MEVDHFFGRGDFAVNVLSCNASFVSDSELKMTLFDVETIYTLSLTQLVVLRVRFGVQDCLSMKPWGWRRQASELALRFAKQKELPKKKRKAAGVEGCLTQGLAIPHAASKFNRALRKPTK